MKSCQLIGLMSGTSLDGLDVVNVHFSADHKGEIKFDLLGFQTYKFPEKLIQKIKSAMDLSGLKFMFLDNEIGDFYGDCVNDFILKFRFDKSKIMAIASHGQTIFHQPDKGLTVQIGNGTNLAVKTGLKVVNNFRTKDVALGGQGAPLVPVGDFALFHSQAESFLNIGGISNISFQKNNKISAFDICPGNLPLNKLANSRGLDYDKNGDLAKKGELNFFLLDLLNELDFYKEKAPKSLGVEWLENHFYPLIKFDKDIENNLRTVLEHEAIQIANVLNTNNLKSVFISGGGALNKFLVDRIAHYFEGKVIIPPKEIIEFKEAIIFAFLGFLYFENKVNSLCSVTGASRDSVGGVLHLPN